MQKYIPVKFRESVGEMNEEGKRLNKYISDAGVASRREADRLIEAGKVEIRRKSRKDESVNEPVRASVGDRVYAGDTVYVDGRELPKKEQEKLYYLYHKPRGVVCTLNRSVPDNLADAVPVRRYVTYAGRLDKDSSGLMILTNDGELANRVMRASQFHEKEYVVTVSSQITEEFLRRMSEGVKIHLDDETTLRRHPGGLYVTTRPCSVKKLGDRKFSIILTQGYNRQIRRMCKALGFTVQTIERIRIMNMKLADLKEGDVRPVFPEELQKLQKMSETPGNFAGTDGKNRQRGDMPHFAAADGKSRQRGDMRRSKAAAGKSRRHGGSGNSAGSRRER